MQNKVIVCSVLDECGKLSTNVSLSESSQQRSTFVVAHLSTALIAASCIYQVLAIVEEFECGVFGTPALHRSSHGVSCV